MSANKVLSRVGSAVFAVGMVLGPQTVGVAAADGPNTDSAASSAHPRGSASNRTARPAAAAAATPAKRTGLGASTAVSPAAASAVPPLNPSSSVATPYGHLGQWMINSQNQIADWIGKPQPVSDTTGASTPCPCTTKTILEGVNVVIVDQAATTATQAKRNLNAWMKQSGFGASAISSTGYKGVLGATTYSQQPTGPSQAFRDGYFLFANSHGRVFGPFLTDNGDYVWTASLSEENWKISDPLTHGYESFTSASTKLSNGMVASGAQNLGTVFMDNQYNVGEFSTGDATGYATVLGLGSVLKAATAPRGGTK